MSVQLIKIGKSENKLKLKAFAGVNLIGSAVVATSGAAAFDPSTDSMSSAHKSETSFKHYSVQCLNSFINRVPEVVLYMKKTELSRLGNMANNNSLPSPVAKRLEGKVALITGGASGIGAATARLFVQHGAKVTIADIQDNLGTSLVQEIGTEHMIFVHCSVAIESDVQNAVDVTVAKFGKLDIMFSNAGIADKPNSSILEVDYDIIKNVFDVNVAGSFFCAKHAARVMIPAKRGSVIFTASAAAVVYGIAPHAYAASKSAVLGLSKNIGVELGKYGIKVNCVSPHYISTPLVLNAFGIAERQMAEQWLAEGGNLKGVLLDEEEVAKAVLYLANDDSKYVSGINLVLDGGYSTTNVALSEAHKKIFPSATTHQSPNEAV
ncbi:short chain aldehyde dehydrogenase 1-like isoform X3 [Lycium barbarum]|uniref:short chain aldehyde dehydrogenase 1-like isoform X3 n=1 Tax=Lycium barbarum TaxID=112863 RepID=UPI00293E6D6F|nr:short chain aldehyde dehydrogenase 1-like isoform X3 [Lycium barbarum]